MKRSTFSLLVLIALLFVAVIAASCESPSATRASEARRAEPIAKIQAKLFVCTVTYVSQDSLGLTTTEEVHMYAWAADRYDADRVFNDGEPISGSYVIGEVDMLNTKQDAERLANK